MSKSRDRVTLSQQIHSAALLYKKNLVGKRFMYVFNGTYIEVIYGADSFRHLTGVETSLSAKQFYRNAVRGKLAASQIDFNGRHPYDLCIKKVAHLTQLAQHATNSCFILEDIKTQTATFKFGATDLRFTICFNRHSEECYIAESLRDGDCVSKSAGAHSVTHIFSMPNTEKLYSEVCFHDEEALNALPVEILSKLSPELRARFES